MTTPCKRRKLESGELLNLRTLVQALVGQTIETAYQENHNRGLQQKLEILQRQVDGYKEQVTQLQQKLNQVEKKVVQIIIHSSWKKNKNNNCLFTVNINQSFFFASSFP